MNLVQDWDQIEKRKDSSGLSYFFIFAATLKEIKEIRFIDRL